MEQREQFNTLIDTLGCSWASIDELIKICDAAPNFWDSTWLASTVEIAKKTLLRKYIRELKDDTNMPLWHSIVTTNQDGEQVRQYKQEALFDKEDYLQVIRYYVERTRYMMYMAETLRDRAVKRSYVAQLTLPWEDGIESV